MTRAFFSFWSYCFKAHAYSDTHCYVQFFYFENYLQSLPYTKAGIVEPNIAMLGKLGYAVGP